MARVKCMAIGKEEDVTTRGKPSIEWYDGNNNPQYYCLGYVDASTGAPLKTCRECRDFVGSSFCEQDFEKFKQRN